MTIENKESILKCPVCNLSLKKYEKQYVCLNNHSYDIASKGHINLLLANQKKTKDPGDCKEMMEGRRDFLNKGYYHTFSDKLNDVIISNINGNNINILDAGCGEGYFLCRLKEAIHRKEASYTRNKEIDFFGVDISKAAVTYATKRDKKIKFIVGSNFNLPIMPGTIDIIIRNFAPSDETELNRVLKDNGKLVVITPGVQHLYGLKEILYVNARKHEEKVTTFDGFKLTQSVEVKYSIDVGNAEDIKSLIAMTPYYWTIDNAMREKANDTSKLSTLLHFNISIYEKN
ncbi:methyltransferase domain-containing protein [Clostridium sp. CM028]|uniref:methyltransferase domain-containing protein n=1 Tax=unclassified Clostridium TaxID=2614128 RepID=UPI001C0DE46D|nr:MULTISPECIES: methyltransferase domain-containing protein [unclassified Clostridium]MBU3091889.1 methyltransferase domain-containing protein [Clostridium sp. CF011]MBW9145740.1 methyltransferase domain-containing protein [Clostridium sp. CM027]MBW9147738.1 methyltransferase domain-containing protein [Clostridium sp. CM028]UVE41413.1 methyltransferase domain-containing protein [Clostridium sp. CM027]WAG70406.1 methyltransferase domain-containing protein [Clostridium sp. CF011]